MFKRIFGIAVTVTLANASVAAADQPLQSEPPRGIYVIDNNPQVEADILPHAARIIYMNRDGGTYFPGNNNSSTNASSIPSTTSTIQPWSVSESGWQSIMDCMVEMYAPFNITITDVDPGDVPHLESVVAGRPQDVGMSSGVGGVSPFTCGVIERSIVFTFAELYGSAQTVCEVAAQETAHSLGLDHEMLCSDPLTYLSPCGAKSFQDQTVPCGEYSNRECTCGGSGQNSYQLLLEAIGPAVPDQPAPPDAAPPPSSPDAEPPPSGPDAAPPPSGPDAGVPAPGGPDAGATMPPGNTSPGDDDEGGSGGVQGGCSTAGGTASMPLALFMAGALLARRRRRRLCSCA